MPALRPVALLRLEPSLTSSAASNLGLGLDGVAWVFKALSDPARLKILAHLASDATGCCGDGICACDLEAVTGLSQPTVSHHMKCLMSAGLVTGEKRGKWMYYSLEARGFNAVKAFLSECC
jgi:ArsR family transcriptional regulator, arsenate/arsenite/antimonite-responsive transcriptional repressor